MGAGIAQVALEAGHQVGLCDQSAEVLPSATRRIRDGLTRRSVTAGSGADWVDRCIARLELRSTVADVAAGSDLVIEAVVEELTAKRSIFRALSAAAPPDAILATNTSALSVAAIAASAAGPERVIGLHFFNPAPLMQLVEVVATPASDPAVVTDAIHLVTAWGKTPVRCTDSPGFIVNRVNRPFTLEALRMLESGEADTATIDGAVRGAGFPMGPFELMDLIGIDVNLAAARGVWEGLGRPDRLRPSPIQERLLAEGHLGRKTGQGFYRYDDSGRGLAPVDLRAAIPERQAHRVLDDQTIVSRIQDAIDAEARLAEAEGVATDADIELALRLGAGHPARTPRVR